MSSNILKDKLDKMFKDLENQKNLIIGGDTNSHHFLWGSHSINPYGSAFEEAISETNLVIINQNTQLYLKLDVELE
jgi:hypothetical protein